MNDPAAMNDNAAADLRSLRVFRATAKAAAGTLDLVMPLRAGGAGATLFFAHPMIGLSWSYLALLPYIDDRGPLYAVQARGIRRPEPLPVTMAEMAEDYADQIRRVQPGGPYHLLGWSLGGNIAFAVAEELQRRGERIGLLVILDANLVGSAESQPGDGPWVLYNMVLAQFGYVPALTPDDPDPDARMLELVRRRPGLGLAEWPEQRIRAMQRVIRNNVAVSGTHQPGVVHSPMLFFSAARNPPGLAQKVAKWGPFVDGPVEAVEVDCDHRHMMLPEPAARIGSVLSERLARIDAAGAEQLLKPFLKHGEA